MLLLGRRRRFCRNCGTVLLAEEGESCPECGLFALTSNEEKWRRIRERVRKNGEASR